MLISTFPRANFRDITVYVAICDDKGAYDGPSLITSGNDVGSDCNDDQSSVSVETKSMYRYVG